MTAVVASSSPQNCYLGTARSSSRRRPVASRSRRPSTAAPPSQQISTSSRNIPRTSNAAETHDRFYGHRDLAELCERVVLALFACPLDATSSCLGGAASPPSSKPAPRLSEFIAYALHRTRLPLPVTHQALFLLRRLKSRFPAARGSSGHRLFISALMLASKSSCDDTYSNKSWTIVGQGLFSLREVNQMERELFAYLGLRVNVEPEDLAEFVAGLEQGSIYASVEPVSPDIGGSSAQFEDPIAESTAESVCSTGPTATASLSPSTMSEPCFSASSIVSRPSLPRPHPPLFNARASIAGYPSMSSQPMRRNKAAPMVASKSDFSFHPVQDYQHHVRSSTAPTQSSTLSVSAQPLALRVAPYYLDSPSSMSLASSSGSLSYGSAMSAYSMCAASPYASATPSSNGTTPATPASNFGDSLHHSWSTDGVEPFDSFTEQPAGTYDSEHSMCSAASKGPLASHFVNQDPFLSAQTAHRPSTFRCSAAHAVAHQQQIHQWMP